MIRLNGKEIEWFKYPAGEVAIKTVVYNTGEVAYIHASIESSDETMVLLLLKDILNNVGYEKTILYLLYCPYARQDRVVPCVSGNQSLSAKVFANIINVANFSEVVLYDPHSTVISALIDRCTVFDTKNFKDFSVYGENICVLSPDVGAIKRSGSISEMLEAPFSFAIKSRNPSNGNIEISMIVDGGNLTNKDVLVIDDICDGGATFTQLAKEAKKFEPKSMNLIVTNGIFSKGIEPLLEYYDTISCYNSFESAVNDPENLKYMKSTNFWSK